MKIVGTAKDEATVTISSSDLAFFQDAINEGMSEVVTSFLEHLAALARGVSPLPPR